MGEYEKHLDIICAAFSPRAREYALAAFQKAELSFAAKEAVTFGEVKHMCDFCSLSIAKHAGRGRLKPLTFCMEIPGPKCSPHT